MRLNTWIPLGLALVLGLAAAIVAKGMLGKGKAAAAPAQLKVVVAKDNVPPGRQLTADDLTLTAVGGDARPDGSFDTAGAVAGRVLTTQLVKGQIVLDTFLAAPGASSGVHNLVPDGMRLITVEVNEFSSLAGMLAPGCRIDILAALSDPETKEMMARTIVENVFVQAVGQRLGAAAQPVNGQPADDQAGFRSVTLRVSPQEAEAIHVASTAGRPWMVLRAPGDNALNASPGVSLAEIRGHARPEKAHEPNATALAKLAPAVAEQPAAPVAEAKKGRTVTFIRGGKTEVVTIDADNGVVRPQPVSPAPMPAAAPTTVTGVETGAAIEK